MTEDAKVKQRSSARKGKRNKIVNREKWPFEPQTAFQELLFYHPIWPTLDTQIKEGASIASIVDHLLSLVDFREYTSATLRKYIYTIIHQMKLSPRVALPQTIVLTNMENLPTVTAGSLYNFMASIQSERVMNLYEKETSGGAHDDTTSKELRLLADIAEGVANREKNEKKNRPLIDPAETSNIMSEQDQLREKFRERFGSITASILQKPDARRRILNAFELVAAGAEGPLKQVIDMNDEKIIEVEQCPSPETPPDNSPG
jgi:hypothetical protein